MSLGESMLAYYRDLAGLTQQELHDDSGVDTAYISQLETGKQRNVSMRVAWKLCRSLNKTGRLPKRITPSDLFPEEFFFPEDVVLCRSTEAAANTT